MNSKVTGEGGAAEVQKYTLSFSPTLKYRIKGAPFIRGQFFLPTFDGNISETVHSIYLKVGVLRVANVNY